MKSISIIPAIMPENYHQIEDQTHVVENLVQTVQVDIMDGKFVPDKTWPFVRGVEKDQKFLELESEDRGLPLWEKLDYELDLMTSNPQDLLDKWIHIGPARMVIHKKSLTKEKLFNLLESYQDIRTVIQIGIAVQNDDEDILFSEGDLSEDLKDLMLLADYVQIMGIEIIGRQGESFDERTLDTIKIFKNIFPDIVIQIDGSVNMQTIEDLAKAGADRFVAGSAVFGGGDVEENVRELESCLDNEE